MSDPIGMDDLPPRDEDKPIKVYRCSKCGERGHSARTCGYTAEQRHASRRGKLGTR